MEIKYNVQAPPKKAFNGGAKSEEVKAIEDFLTSGNAKNKTYDKLKALELLGKHLGMFTDKLKMEGNVPVVIMGDDQLED